MVALTFDGIFFIIIIFHCCRLNFRAAATVLSFYGAFTTIKEKKTKTKTAHKEIFIVRRSQGHMQVNFIVSVYETAANCFSFLFFLFSLVVFALFTCLFVLLVCFFFYDLSIVGFHLTPLKFKLKKLSILPGFYFDDALEQLKTNFHIYKFLL